MNFEVVVIDMIMWLGGDYNIAWLTSLWFLKKYPW